MSDPRRFLDYLEAERNAALLYRTLAESTDGERREALLELAGIEERHSQHWIAKLTEAGIAIPEPPTALAADDRRLVSRAQSMGLEAVLDTLEQTETAAESAYDDEPEAPASMAADERLHAATFRRMAVASAKPSKAPMESWHRVDASGSLRAAVFGISDGLVSNTALVMGFVGANPDSRTILFAGLAGLLAGAFSMAAGEYVSVASQRDMFRKEIAMEAAELEAKPEEERDELELIYRAKGLSREEAKNVADRIMSNPKTALETLAREELGLDPDELGSPVKVALSSFVSFAIGAAVVVVPFLFASGTPAVIAAIALALVALVVVGGLVGRTSGRGVAVSAFRQVAWGAGAALVTYCVGRIIGVSVTS